MRVPQSIILLCGRRTFLEQWFDYGLESCAGPFADHLIADSSFAIDYVSCGQRRRWKLRADLTPAEHDLITLRNVFLKALHQIGRVVIRYSDYAQSAPFKVLLHRTERWNFRTTGDAPGRPEVQNHDPATQVLQPESASVKLRELYVRSRLKRLTGCL